MHELEEQAGGAKNLVTKFQDARLISWSGLADIMGGFV